MSDCKVFLPLSVSAEHVFYVIGKYMGIDFDYHVFPQDVFNPYTRKSTKVIPPFDPAQPASVDNPWHIKFDKSFKINMGNHYYTLYFDFKDLVGKSYSFLFMQETEFEDYKLLSIDSSAIHVALAKTIINFFGGRAHLNGDIDNNSQSLYICEKPLFPSKKNGQTPDDRWYQFYNALNQVHLITADDIQQSSDISGYFTPEDKNLIDYLMKKELKKSLDLELSQGSTIKQPKI